jgi:hypothetical protein
MTSLIIMLQRQKGSAKAELSAFLTSALDAGKL